MPSTGVVIGKFYPPHRGHHFLIDTARSRVDELSAIVGARPAERPDAALRAAWLREVHPGVRVLVAEDRYSADGDSLLWARLTVRWLGRTPDVAFTSEEYGPRWARLMGCAHVAVDPDRVRFPVSGTAVRADPLACWEFLEPCVRAHFAARVVVVGAESTGTTTMARALAERYRTCWVPDYGRERSEELMRRFGGYRWSSADFTEIAAEQSRREDVAARLADRLLVCDTDALATAIWHERYLGVRSAEVEAIAAARRCDLYLLTGVDAPFVQDGLRDGEHLREWMHGRFLAELTRSGVPFAVLTGSHERRLAQAAELIEARWPRLAPVAE